MAVLACREFLDLLRVVIDFFQVRMSLRNQFTCKINVNKAI
jgi:hypothetical protein